MSGKHTPGPWDVERLGCVLKGGIMHPPAVDETREPGESWLDMRARTQPARDAREAEIAANARLRAAAPEMLEALKQWRDAENAGGCSDEQVDRYLELMARAEQRRDELIERLEGQS